ncbi:MAG: DUF4011 domain-containing protein [Actinomycetota bacterium]|nr:DUF4011 domain-containing protein [Actinomycetota bacterium]
MNIKAIKKCNQYHHTNIQHLGRIETIWENISISEENEIFEKIRRIYDNYTNNPYELEIIYCYLFILGKTNDGKQVFAPLFTIPAELTYEENKNSFVISLTSDELRLNIFALAGFMVVMVPHVCYPWLRALPAPSTQPGLSLPHRSL